MDRAAATEVALLVLAGTAVVSGLPFYAILSLPILFATGPAPGHAQPGRSARRLTPASRKGPGSA